MAWAGGWFSPTLLRAIWFWSSFVDDLESAPLVPTKNVPAHRCPHDPLVLVTAGRPLHGLGRRVVVLADVCACDLVLGFLRR
jgi:hypothetical protein